jgi:hypothetical protein
VTYGLIKKPDNFARKASKEKEGTSRYNLFVNEVLPPINTSVLNLEIVEF